MKFFLEINKKYANLPVTIKASVWFVICGFLQRGISLITTPIFTRLLSTEQYGEFNVFYSWLDICTIFITLNIYAGVYSSGLVKCGEGKKEYSSSMLGLCNTLVFVYLILYLCSCDFWNALFSQNTTSMLCMFTLIWSSMAYTFWFNLKRNEYKYKSLVFVTIFTIVVSSIAEIFAVKYSADKVQARILTRTIIYFAIYGVLFFQILIKGKKYFDKSYWIYGITMGIPLVPHYLSQIILNEADRLMIDSMIDSSAAGIYSLAYSVSCIMSIFCAAMLNSLEPWILQNIKKRNIGRINTISYICISLIALVNVLLILIAPELIRLFSPPEYHEAIYVMPPIIISVVFKFMYSIFACYEFYYKKTSLIAVASVIAALLNVGLNYVFINIFGYRAAGYTTLICYMVYALFHLLFSINICKKEMPGTRIFSWKAIALLSICSTFIGMVLMGVYELTILRYSLLAVVIIGCYIKRRYIIGVIRSIKC